MAGDENQGIYLTWPKVKFVCTVRKCTVYWDFEINKSKYLLLLFLMYKKPLSVSLCYNIINIPDNNLLTPLFSLSRVVFQDSVF